MTTTSQPSHFYNQLYHFSLVKNNSLTTLFLDMDKTINRSMRVMTSKGTISEVKKNKTMFLKMVLVRILSWWFKNQKHCISWIKNTLLTTAFSVMVSDFFNNVTCGVEQLKFKIKINDITKPYYCKYQFKYDYVMI